jgi:hypothetical protein
VGRIEPACLSGKQTLGQPGGPVLYGVAAKVVKLANFPLAFVNRTCERKVSLLGSRTDRMDSVTCGRRWLHALEIDAVNLC